MKDLIANVADILASKFTDMLSFGKSHSHGVVLSMDQSPQMEARMANLLARFSSTPMGGAILGFLKEQNSQIKFNPYLESGSHTRGQASEKNIYLNAHVGDDELMATLAHEARHIWQNQQTGSIKNHTLPPDAAVAITRFREADAFAFGQKYVEDFGLQTGDMRPLEKLVQGIDHTRIKLGLPINSAEADAKRFESWHDELKRHGTYDIEEMQEAHKSLNFRDQYGFAVHNETLADPKKSQQIVAGIARRIDGTWPFKASDESNSHFLSKHSDAQITSPSMINPRTDLMPIMEGLQDRYAAQHAARTPAAPVAPAMNAIKMSAAAMSTPSMK